MEFIVSESKNRTMLGIFLMIFIFFIILMIFAFYTVSVFKSHSSGFELSANTEDTIGVVEVTGIVLDAKKTVEKLLLAEEDDKVQAIIVRISSPGGAVGPCQEIYEEIIRIDKKKPVYASFGSVAASGGYYIGAAARKIYAAAGTLTGSIGVIMQFYNLSKLFEYIKVSPEVIKAGKFKDIGQPSRSMTQEERELMTGMLARVHKQFIKHIFKRRKGKIKGSMEDLAQGQIFSGEDAHKAGLIDEIGGLWTLGRKIHSEMKLKGKFTLKYIKKKKEFTIFDMLDKFEEVITKLDFKSRFESTGIPMYIYKN